MVCIILRGGLGRLGDVGGGRLCRVDGAGCSSSDLFCGERKSSEFASMSQNFNKKPCLLRIYIIFFHNISITIIIIVTYLILH